ncbi:MAG: DUF5067 domain-containing protein [Atopobiaceae bacterium]|nr:DUF5067 domain-containing protein [Atopobiaceae bacterium]
MKVKKIIAWLLSAVLFAGIAAGLSGDSGAFAADLGTEVPGDVITINYDTEAVLIDESGLAANKQDEVIYFTETYTSDLTKWSRCKLRDNRGSFDISWARATSDLKLYICGDVNKKISSVVLKWQDTLNVKFTGTLLATDITVYQDGVECEDAYFSGENSDGYSNKVKAGVSVDVTRTYKLQNTTSDVEVEVGQLSFWDDSMLAYEVFQIS